MRQLATIQKIKTLTPIEGKDRIVLASFFSSGFKVIVNKSDVKEGDLVVYFEMDTLLPPNTSYEFLRKRCWNEKWQGFRISGMKMGGVLSEGLCLPLSLVPFPQDVFFKEGDDVSEILNVRKYDPELEEEKSTPIFHTKFKSFLVKTFPFLKEILFPKIEKGDWPKFFPPKTDETRIQSVAEILPEMLYQTVYATEKLDGSSFTAGLHKNKLYVCSRNQWYKSPADNNFWNVAQKYDLLHILKKAKRKYGELVIQGEICGPKIQGNKYGFKELRLFIFNVYSIQDKQYLRYDTMVEFANTYKLTLVPEVKKYMWTLVPTIEQLVEEAKGYSVFGDKVLREGIVVRPSNYQKGRDKTGPVFGFKVINPDFIEKWKL